MFSTKLYIHYYLVTRKFFPFPHRSLAQSPWLDKQDHSHLLLLLKQNLNIYMFKLDVKNTVILDGF